jgi:hypothetical protein
MILPVIASFVSLAALLAFYLTGAVLIETMPSFY